MIGFDRAHRHGSFSASAGAEIRFGEEISDLTRRVLEAVRPVHRERPFFRDLVSYMTSGPVIVQVLEGENAVAKHREIMGATDPKKAAPGTIRADLAESIEQNVVHGSDSLENAAREVAYFFAETELCPR